MGLLLLESRGGLSPTRIWLEEEVGPEVEGAGLLRGLVEVGGAMSGEGDLAGGECCFAGEAEDDLVVGGGVESLESRLLVVVVVVVVGWEDEGLSCVDASAEGDRRWIASGGDAGSSRL